LSQLRIRNLGFGIRIVYVGGLTDGLNDRSALVLSFRLHKFAR